MPASVQEAAPARGQNSTLPRVAVIGAGSSSIATCKVLHEARVSFDCFEASDQVGGNWVFKRRVEMAEESKAG